MKRYILWLAALCLLDMNPASGQPTSFTYQGRLALNGEAANGNYDFTFKLHETDTGESPVAGTVTNGPIAVSNGLFTAVLDFGASAFPGADRWLEVGVRPYGGPTFQVLQPRQKVTALPYAMAAAQLTGIVPAGGISGTYANPVGFTSPVNVFAGDGAALRNLSLDALGSPGTFADASTVDLVPQPSIATYGDGSGFTAAADLNDDGRMDLAVANGSSGTVTILINNPEGFLLTDTITCRAGVSLIVLRDLNHDKLPDVICANGDNSITVAINQGNGSFKNASFHNATPVLTSLAVGDLNGDGWPDIVTGAQNTNVVSLFMNNGAGGFPSSPSSLFTTAVDPMAVALADVTGDARTDLVIAHGSQALTGKAVDVYTGNGAGGFSNLLILQSGLGLKSLAIADLNRDGTNDILVGDGQSGAHLDVFLNIGGGQFSLSQTLPTVYVSSLTTGDFNGDGYPDVALKDAGFFGYAGLRLMLNDGTGRLSPVFTQSGFGYASVATGDLDGDHRSELLATLPGAPGQVAVFGVRLNVKPGFLAKGAATFYENVGIGTLAPQQLLHLNVTPGHGEGLLIESAVPGHAPAMYLNHTAAGGHNFRLASYGDNVNQGSFRIRDETLGFAGDRLVIDAFGNIGIGVTNPAEKMQIFGNLLVNGNINLPPPGALNFGSQTRQMINLWSTGYALGVQSGTHYARSDARFSWFKGGVHSDTENDPGGGSVLMTLTSAGLTVNGTLVSSSDRQVKAGFTPVDAGEILEKVAALPITRWHYTNDATTPHLGPVAQDFFAAFAVGMDDRHIATVDADGVALAAIKGLNEKVEQQRLELNQKKTELAELNRRLEALEKIINQPKADQPHP